MKNNFKSMLSTTFQFIKNNFGSCLSWAVTIAWLLFIFSKIQKGIMPINLNEFGDFIAGAFAPLAFFWLVRGFYQQGIGLKQNSKALNLQAEELQKSTEALNLQAEELKNSVEEQKKLIQIHQDEQLEKHFLVLPNFLILKKNTNRYHVPYMFEDDEGNTIESGEEEILEISFELMNRGEVARNVLIKNVKNQLFYRKEKYKLNHDEHLNISLKFDEQTIDHLDKGAKISNTLELTYMNIYGKTYANYVYYSISFVDCPEACKTFIDLSVEIKNDQD